MRVPNSRQLRRLVVLGAVGAAVGLLSTPSLAGADTFCVNIAGCPPAATFDNDLEGALVAAQMNFTDPDTVRIGPVTLAQGPYLTSSAVDIVGAGVGQTVLTNPSGATQAVLELTGEGNESVSDLSIRMVSADPFVSEGLVIYGGVAEDLEIAPAGPPGASSIGAVIGLGATLRRAVISVPTMDGSTAVSMNGGALVEHATLVGSTGIFSGSTGNPGPQSTNVGRYLNITARHSVEVVGSTLRLESSLLRAPGPFSLGLSAQGQAGTTESAAIEGTNLTVIGDGKAGGEGIRAEAVRSGAPRHADATVTLRNSILRDFATPIWRHGESALIGINAGVANVLISHSAYDSSIAPVQAGPGAVTAADNLGPIDPRFAGPGDFHLLDGSPLIDAGQADGLPETDLDGAPRVLDGNGDGTAAPDIGAFEHAAVPVAVGDTTPPLNTGGNIATAGDTTPPRLTKVSLSHGRFRFVLSESAAVTIGFEHAAPGRRSDRTCAKPNPGNRKGKPCIRWTKLGATLRRDGLAAGANAISFSGRIRHRALPAGRYRAVLSAIDPTGNSSAAHRLAFRIADDRPRPPR